MKKTFVITTTEIKKIVVQAYTEVEAENIAKTQMKNGESVLMISTEDNNL
jgi:hypothetical protein